MHSGTTLDRREFLKLLECLSDEFPKNLQHRTLSVLQQQQQSQPQNQQPQGSVDSAIVSFTELQRGVEVYLLLEGSCACGHFPTKHDTTVQYEVPIT